MNVYYCEITGNETRPHFSGYKTEALTAADAVAWFKARHGARLEMVYDEDFKIVWER